MRVLSLPWTERVLNDEVLRSVGGKRMLIGSIVGRRSNVVVHLLHHSKWFTHTYRGGSGRGRPRMEYTDGLKEERMYVVITRLSTERKKLRAYQPVG